jgi:phosphoglycolate phosphatase-like HAD superfamily hydrolase
MHALVFDLDGTLVDSVYAHLLAWQCVLGEAGVHVAFCSDSTVHVWLVIVPFDSARELPHRRLLRAHSSSNQGGNRRKPLRNAFSPLAQRLLFFVTKPHHLDAY